MRRMNNHINKRGNVKYTVKVIVSWSIIIKMEITYKVSRGNHLFANGIVIGSVIILTKVD